MAVARAKKQEKQLEGLKKKRFHEAKVEALNKRKAIELSAPALQLAPGTLKKSKKNNNSNCKSIKPQSGSQRRPSATTKKPQSSGSSRNRRDRTPERIPGSITVTPAPSDQKSSSRVNYPDDNSTIPSSKNEDDDSQATFVETMSHHSGATVPKEDYDNLSKELNKRDLKAKEVQRDLQERMTRMAQGGSSKDAKMLQAKLDAQITSLKTWTEANERLQKINKGLKTQVANLKKKVAKAEQEASSGGDVSEFALQDLRDALKEAKTSLETEEDANRALGEKYNRLKADNKRLKEQAAKKPTNNNDKQYSALAKKYNNLKSKFDEVKKDKKELEESNAALSKKLKEATARLQKSKLSCASEQSKEILSPVKEHMKDVIFRTTKLVSSKKESEVAKLTKRIFDGIKKERGFEDKKSDDYLTLEEFHRIYKAPIMKHLSTLRSSTQTACGYAINGTYEFQVTVRQFYFSFHHV